MVGPGYAPFRMWDAGCFKIDGGMADQKQEVEKMQALSALQCLLGIQQGGVHLRHANKLHQGVYNA